MKIVKSVINAIKSLFKAHENCRVCGTPLTNGGHGVSFVGGGFCRKHAAALNSHSAKEGK